MSGGITITDRDMRTLTRALVKDGWGLHPIKNHIKLTHPDLGRMTMALTTSDWRARKNNLAKIKRIYRDAGRDCPIERY